MIYAVAFFALLSLGALLSTIRDLARSEVHRVPKHSVTPEIYTRKDEPAKFWSGIANGLGATVSLAAIAGALYLVMQKMA